MQHYRNPDSCAEICNARRKIPVSRIKGVIDLLLNHVVDAVYLLETRRQLRTGFEHLHPQVVFFVNHRGERFPLRDDRAARAFAEGVISAD